jgi:transaldolase/glucose-6-phosphate isomerase
MTDAHDHQLQAIRELIRDKRGVATTLGYGPRFLHSTGQLHKGGPASGVFLHLTAEPASELAIPGESYTFATLERAQAQGDFEVLGERGRRVLRVHLGRNVEGGLAALRRYIEAALGVGA